MKKVILITLIIVTALLLIGAVAVSMYGVGSGESYRPDAKTHEALKAMKVRQAGDRRYFGDAWMERKERVLRPSPEGLTL